VVVILYTSKPSYTYVSLSGREREEPRRGTMADKKVERTVRSSAEEEHSATHPQNPTVAVEKSGPNLPLKSSEEARAVLLERFREREDRLREAEAGPEAEAPAAEEAVSE
jgi:hypothetical protein